MKKLLDRLRIDWQDNHSLPVQLARAQIAGLRTAGDSQGRYQAKWQLVRKLYEIGYNAEQVRELFGLIDWMMHLRLDLEQRFKQELDELEENLRMPYVTSVERIARAEGRTEAFEVARFLSRQAAQLHRLPLLGGPSGAQDLLQLSYARWCAGVFCKSL